MKNEWVLTRIGIYSEIMESGVMFGEQGNGCHWLGCIIFCMTRKGVGMVPCCVAQSPSLT